MYKIPHPQVNQSHNLKEYPNRIIVAGTRGFDDKILFHSVLMEFISDLDGDILFFSGAASTGADRLIIQWCEKYKFPCKLYPANWDEEGIRAGFNRNYEMSKYASHCLAFWDKVSHGTKHMIDTSRKQKLNLKVVLIPHN